MSYVGLFGNFCIVFVLLVSGGHKFCGMTRFLESGSVLRLSPILVKSLPLIPVVEVSLAFLLAVAPEVGLFAVNGFFLTMLLFRLKRSEEFLNRRCNCGVIGFGESSEKNTKVSAAYFFFSVTLHAFDSPFLSVFVRGIGFWIYFLMAWVFVSSFPAQPVVVVARGYRPDSNS